MRASGTVSLVEAEDAVTHLTAAASIGATVLTVDNATIFDPAGGVLVTDEVPLDYVAADHEAGTVTLAAPLGAALEAEAPLVASGNVTYRAVVTTDDTGTDDDTAEGVGVVSAVVETRMIGWLAPGEYDPPVTVDLELRDGQWHVIDRPGQEPGFDATVVQTPVLSLYLSANQLVPDNAATRLKPWTVLTSTTDDIFVDPLDPGVIRVAQAGHYEITAFARWDTNGSGRRTLTAIWLYSSGTFIGPTDAVPAATIFGLSNSMSDLSYLKAGEGLGIDVFQTSGAALNVLGGSPSQQTSLRVKRVGP